MIIKMFLGIILSLIMVGGNFLGITKSNQSNTEVSDVSNTQEENITSNEEVKETPKADTGSAQKATEKNAVVTTKKQENAVVSKPTPVSQKSQTSESKKETTISTPTVEPKAPIAEEQPKNNTPTVVPEKPKETFEPNYEMIETLKQAIRNNESDYMKTYGYEIVVDSSIKKLTNPFTYTEIRIKPMLKHRFGTIRIYAENYYVGGELVMVECYLM